VLQLDTMNTPSTLPVSTCTIFRRRECKKSLNVTSWGFCIDRHVFTRELRNACHSFFDDVHSYDFGAGIHTRLVHVHV